MRNWILLFFLLLLIPACKSTKNSTTSTQEPQLLISMEKTSCMGTCPVYTIQIMDNGEVYLDAKENLEMIGEFRSDIKKHKLKKLLRAFNSADFFSLDDTYLGAGASDLPTTYLSYNYQGKQKKIKDYSGAPEKLKDLEKQISGLVNDLRWRRRVVSFGL